MEAGTRNGGDTDDTAPARQRNDKRRHVHRPEPHRRSALWFPRCFPARFALPEN